MLDRLLLSLGRVGVITLVGGVSALLLHLSLKSIEKWLRDSSVSGERLKRLTTLVRVWRSVGHVLIVLIIGLMILHELGVNITPILASAGIVGLAFSLGAQTVIKDFLSGIVILIENQFAIGDVITVGTLTGTVEHITLRATYLRDMEGKLHLIPNGDIRTISNLTAKWAQVVVTFNFDYETEMERAVHALKEAARQVESDQELAAALCEAPQVLGWTGFTDWAVQAQILAKTHAGQQWRVARKLRQTALSHLQKEGIRLAVPRQRVENLF